MYPGNALEDALMRLVTRRSVKALDLQTPGPNEEQLETILSAAIRVPDHGKLAPWRFIEFNGQARSEFGEVLADCFFAQNPAATPAQIENEKARFERAPVIVAVIGRINPEHKIPVWEQTLSAGAACQNLLIAANMMGFSAQWLTEWYAYDSNVDKALGLTPQEQVAGYIYIGSASEKPPERPRASLEEVRSVWRASSS
jgi:nitroreductase